MWHWQHCFDLAPTLGAQHAGGGPPADGEAPLDEGVEKKTSMALYTLFWKRGWETADRWEQIA
jgi:hypothetical protein